MSKLDELVSFLKKSFYDSKDEHWSWAEAGKAALADFLSSGERYGVSTYKEDGRRLVAIRNPRTDMGNGIPYIALVQPAANSSGSYDGTSLVLFPSSKEDGAALLTLCIGTDGINADADVLSRPGHARRLSAMADYLNKTYGNGRRVAWAKKDPCAIEQPLPDGFLRSVLEHDVSYEKAIGKQSSYNSLLYFIADVSNMPDSGAKESLVLLMDMMMEIRRAQFLKIADESKSEISRSNLKKKYLPFLFPNLTKGSVKALLEKRRFVIIQGPPGTGKTHLVVGKDGLMEDYSSHGRSIQFHPNVTYENFIGGLFPESTRDDGGLGFKFKAKPGVLMECAKLARDNPKSSCLLHIDEINRADLSRVLGEAIFLFEPRESRKIALDHDYGSGYGNELELPPNLYIIGTMNTADKSVAPIDIAIRRRFAFVDLYPQISVVEKESKSPLAREAFIGLLDLFIDYASEDSFKYLPGHSYFIADDDNAFKTRMCTEIIPLLNEYLEAGLVASMATYVGDYIQQYRDFCLSSDEAAAQRD